MHFPGCSTNAYIYAVDPRSNAIVDMNILQSIMSQMSAQSINTTLHIIELGDVAGLNGGGGGRSSDRSAAEINGTVYGSDDAGGDLSSGAAGLQMAELASIILGVIVFAGSLSTAICVACVRYRR